MSRSTLLLLVAVPAVFVVACGSDTTSGTTSTGAGGEAATTATGTGGAGGSGGSISTTGTGSSTATSSSSSSSSASSSSASGSAGTGVMMMGACTNQADLGIIQTKDVKKIAEDCGKMNLGMEPATKNCIKMGTALSDPCVTCFDDIVQCVVAKCFNQCFADPGSAACKTCRETNCNPAFAACSGLPPT
ncbi:MAG: hypothetical protein ACMG6S_00915 [Byssovorax sp.]